MNLIAMCLVQGPCARARISASKLGIIMGTSKSFLPLNVNNSLPRFNQRRMDSKLA